VAWEGMHFKDFGTFPLVAIVTRVLIGLDIVTILEEDIIGNIP